MVMGMLNLEKEVELTEDVVVIFRRDDKPEVRYTIWNYVKDRGKWKMAVHPTLVSQADRDTQVKRMRKVGYLTTTLAWLTDRDLRKVVKNSTPINLQPMLKANHPSVVGRISVWVREEVQ